MNVAFPDLLSAAAALQRGEMSPVELVTACLARIDARNGALNAFIDVFRDRALADARAAEGEIRAGRSRGLLHGIPVSIKDLVDVVGSPTTSGSAVTPRRPTADATVITRLKQAGAILVGKTNLHEFAYGTTSDETAFGAVRNPADPSRSAGGSSAGAAVAIVEGMCLGSVGTDTGGSIRIPAAACGVTGLKPTVGEIPTDGVVPLSVTFDHVGPLARTVADTGILYDAMLGQKPAAVAATDAPLRFAVPGGYFQDKLDDDVRRMQGTVHESLRAAGHRIDMVEIAHALRTPDVYLHVMLPEASWYHAPMLATEADRYSPGVRLRLEMGRYVLAEDYVRAMHARTVLRQAVDRALDGADALLLPTLPIAAPPLGATTVRIGETQEPVRALMLRLTQLFNVTGHPAIALPCGNGQDGLPRSIQVVGRHGHTRRLLQVAAAVERHIRGGSGSVGGGTE